MSHVVREPGVLAGTRMAVFLALAHAVNDILTAMLGALLPTLQARLAAGTTTLALLVAVFSVSSSVTQPLLGALADRIGHRTVAGLGVIVTAVTMSLVGVAGSVPLLLVLLLLGGLGSAALHPVSTSIVGGPSARNPGLAVGLFTAGGMAGLAAGPVVILHVVATDGADATPWLMVPGLLLGIGVLTLLPRFEPHGTGRISTPLDRRVRTAPVGRLTVASALISLAFLAFTSGIPLWLVDAHGAATDAPLLGWTLAAFSSGAAIGAVAGGVVGARLGYDRATAASLVLSAPALISVLLLPPGAPTLVAAALAGALIYASQPLLVVAAQRAVPRNPATAAGVVMGLGFGAAGLLYVPVGALQDVVGLAPAMILAFLLVLPAAAIASRALGAREQAPQRGPAGRPPLPKPPSSLPPRVSP